MRSAITVSLVPQASGGPFVFWNGLAAACEVTSQLGFDAIEIFPPEYYALNLEEIRGLLDKHRLAVAAVGSGGGWVINRWHLCHPDPQVRTDAVEFLHDLIPRAAELNAPVVLGSMQGRVEAGVTREQALGWLRDTLEDVADGAEKLGQPFLFEPLNRYETNLFNTLGAAAEFLNSLETRNVRLLADLFHMNIEEASIPDAIRAAGPLIGHVHFADSNRHAIGFGHTDVAPAMRALRDIDYQGYLSAEVLPLPDAHTAAAQTMHAFRQHCS